MAQNELFDLNRPFGAKRQNEQVEKVAYSEMDECPQLATYPVPMHRADGSHDDRCFAESLVEGVIAYSDTTG
ncbi:MAG TPA: hypothetical protein VFC03_22410 [Acidimicrobiales bacterium]|nr:hypothetical protein [Acidimicrobiales bacterium]